MSENIYYSYYTRLKMQYGIMAVSCLKQQTFFRGVGGGEAGSLLENYYYALWHYYMRGYAITSDRWTGRFIKLKRVAPNIHESEWNEIN